MGSSSERRRNTSLPGAEHNPNDCAQLAVSVRRGGAGLGTCGRPHAAAGRPWAVMIPSTMAVRDLAEGTAGGVLASHPLDDGVGKGSVGARGVWRAAGSGPGEDARPRSVRTRRRGSEPADCLRRSTKKSRKSSQWTPGLEPKTHFITSVDPVSRQGTRSRAKAHGLADSARPRWRPETLNGKDVDPE